ncbi:hypothetical protein [Methanobacterium formicicum]|uniref:Uncharacterized protein n=2 Tax=Methanobacterium TaxID=2160 RepID=A0A090I4Z0_METFO|nr:hypothetical protein [Methanobacterium formicicum]MDG3546245.1 hypothetical protein [Methanobacterium formicicum]MDH2658328.1 hypothetical protein [Methanobacterium formicicum]CEA14548.1 hypothetical protein DSM1535_2228 [Methanobacterium formicicum]
MNIKRETHDYIKIREESDLSLEVVILLILGVFMFLFGLLLFKISTGELPYTPDSTYGLFLVIVSFQVITMGKTPFGDLRRSWVLVLIGIITAIVGMVACFIPGQLTEMVRILVGVLLFAGGISLLLQLLFFEGKARTWIKIPGVLQHLTVACGVVYVITIVLGLITLIPGITSNFQTALFLLIYGISIFYLAWCIQKVARSYPPENLKSISKEKGGLFKSLQSVSLSLSPAVVIMIGVLLFLLGCLLFPINQGTLPFSSDGELGLLTVILALQMTTLGETPLGQFKRSVIIIIVGIVFATLGIFSCIVPGILTGVLQILIGALNILGGVILLSMRFVPIIRGRKKHDPETGPPSSTVKKFMVTQTLLNLVAIAFGLSMIMPGMIPNTLVPVILIINGLLLFALAYIIN